MTADREAIRCAMLRKRDAYPAPARAAASQNAQELLIASPLWRNAESVGLYMAIRSEIATDLLLAAALAAKKKVWLPKIVDPATKQMRLYQYQGGSLTHGQCGIPEPAAGPEPQKLDLLILPGAAFDRSGTRLGYGAGYYDRYLKAHDNLKPVCTGFCFSFQIIDNIPAKSWDMPVSALCSEDGLLCV